MNKPLRWSQISSGNIPKKPGVYAWYYKYSISIAEIEKLEDRLNSTNNTTEKREYIDSFFKQVVFEKFDEEPYEAKLTGKLKPSYSGTLCQSFSIANTFIDTILKSPKEIYRIKDELETIDMAFSSPLYIGMAQNLSSRIIQHRDGIIDAKSHQNSDYDWGDDVEMNSFAKRFSNRNLKSTNLYVVFKELDSESNIHNPMEYILNRINYPLLGRN